MKSTNRYCWLWVVVVLSAAAGLMAAAAAIPAHSARLGPSKGGLAIVWNPTRKDLQEIGLLRKLQRHELGASNTEPKAIPKPPYPPPTFRPGTHGFDFLWGSPDFLPKGPPAPFADHSPKKK